VTRYRPVFLITAIMALAGLAAAAPPVSGQAAQVYFSDTGDPGGAVVALVGRAQRRIEAAIYDLTDRRIAEALIAASRRHVDTWVVMDASEARYHSSQYPALAAALGGHLALRTGRGGGRYAIMHHKFIVVDDRLVGTGSFNWTREAECCNWENLVVLDDPAVARAFEAEFQRLWRAQ
jgi:phosphatidylserine/phosphatidylglycerophosphate/cardiolipin synthase-like enzyme